MVPLPATPVGGQYSRPRKLRPGVAVRSDATMHTCGGGWVPVVVATTGEAVDVAAEVSGPVLTLCTARRIASSRVVGPMDALKAVDAARSVMMAFAASSRFAEETSAVRPNWKLTVAGSTPTPFRLKMAVATRRVMRVTVPLSRCIAVYLALS